jgi:cell division protein FtsB
VHLLLRRIGLAIVVVLASVYGYMSLRGPQGIPALMEKWREIRKLEEDNAALQRENDYRRERIKKLQDSPSEQELEIRKKLKLLRPGETSFILPDQPKHDESKDEAKPVEPPAPPEEK